ncbi:related to Staphylococcus multidrug resistance protein [Melanopsichium pennsylvanicum]|uniref:Related to Staphylococcus multidrug resistance protein n=2 Tax=Melanopsichium pennsylvanicum TaxID=63383 RepID=A0AAJ4XQ76_9BASI|nr:major facilitator superfamily transporter protein [Melanopsichium pennsylvanicum 4]SNX85887.1 related to Staphylococcus multidrug resistance protein [Melanopsichium pennsylvanicum]
MPSTSNQNTFEHVSWSQDVWLLLAARFVRMLAFGSSSLILALFLTGLGQKPIQVGRFLTLTLIGDFLLSLVLTFIADSVLGRRNTLRLGALSMLISGLVFATTQNRHLLLIAAIFGVISPSGNEIGPFRAVEESILAELVHKQHRPSLFGWYVVTGSLAASLATWLGGFMNNWIGISAKADARADLMRYYRLVFVVYSVLGFIKLMLSLALSKRCERPARTVPCQANPTQGHSDSVANECDPLLPSPDSTNTPAAEIQAAEETFGRSRFVGLCVLFAIDSLGSGMVSQTLQSWFLSRKFHVELPSLGAILSAALLVSSFSNLFSARLAKHLGLVPTMVLTHMPSSIILALTPLPTSLTATSALIIARAATSSMDQAPRSAFLSAFVPSHHRTRVLGLVNTVKTLAQSGGPTLTGWLTDKRSMGWAFHVAGALKTAYDLGLLAAFSAVK